MIAETSSPDEDDDVDVRARLDAAFQGLAEHPRHGDAAAHPRQHRRARRRHERAARPFEHPGADRHRADVEPDPRLSDAADRKEVDFDKYMSSRGFKPLRPNQTSYWQNYKKFFVSFQKSMWGDAATPDNNFAYDYLPKLDVPTYDILRTFELMHQGKLNGYFCQGFNPLLSFPNRKKDHRGAVEAQIPRRHGSARHRDGAVLAEPRRVQRRRHREDRHRSDPAAHDLLCRGRRLADQLRALAAMALGGRHAARRSQARHLDHGAALSCA